MKLFSHLSIIRGIGYLLVFILCVNCKKDFNSTNPIQPPSESMSASAGAGLITSQTRTATFLNNLNNFQDVFGNQGYPRAKAEYVSTDDGKYASTGKLSANGNWSSTLVLQGFGFTIPDDAIIENISVRVRRFKNGKPAIGDYFLNLMQRFQCGLGPCSYGVFWTYQDDYPGKMYPDTETEYIFSQTGNGSNGGFNHNQVYQWTPAIVNHQYFGVTIASYQPIGKGSVVINYDLVEVTVEYSQPATITGG
ncbi:MAG TPA: hypothetical protein VFH08_04890 [Chitinophagaceae bacterium]|nr:hypothetical protein [Chitinophagaceae bacterium]